MDDIIIIDDEDDDSAKPLSTDKKGQSSGQRPGLATSRSSAQHPPTDAGVSHAIKKADSSAGPSHAGRVIYSSADDDDPLAMVVNHMKPSSR